MGRAILQELRANPFAVGEIAERLQVTAAGKISVRATRTCGRCRRACRLDCSGKTEQRKLSVHRSAADALSRRAGSRVAIPYHDRWLRWHPHVK